MRNPQLISDLMIKRLDDFLLRSATRKRCPFLPLLFNIVLEVLAKEVKAIKRNKWHPHWKGRNETILFTDYI